MNWTNVLFVVIIFATALLIIGLLWLWTTFALDRDWPGWIVGGIPIAVLFVIFALAAGLIIRYDGPYFAVHGDGGGKGTIPEWRHAMGIDWMNTKHDLAEAIPPAYTRWIGERFRERNL